MGDERVAQMERRLIDKTLRRMDKESCQCGPAYGKFADVATAVGFDKGTMKIVKSVYGHISGFELGRLLNFNEAPPDTRCVLEVWFWKIKEREPFARQKLFYNQPEQRLSESLRKLVKQ